MFDLDIVKSIIKGLLYLISGLIAILFIIKGGTIHQYESKATNFKRKEIPVIQRPVVTICPKLNSSYKYGIDFNISIGSIVAKLGSNTVKCSEFYNEYGSYDYQPTYDDCDYDYLDVYETSFTLESMRNLWRRMSCYKIVYDPNIMYDAKIPFQVVLVFGDSIPFEELPENIHVYLTSNDNSYGVIYNAWIDGNELWFQFPKVRIKMSKIGVYCLDIWLGKLLTNSILFLLGWTRRLGKKSSLDQNQIISIFVCKRHIQLF